MNNETFETRKFTENETENLFNFILNKVASADTSTKQGQKDMDDALLLYVEYVANSRNLHLTYSFRDDTKALTKKEQEALKNSNKGVTLGMAFPDHNHILFSSFLRQAKSIGDFAFYVNVVDHEFEHIAAFKQQNYYNFDNPNGLRTEFCCHHEALDNLLDFMKQKGNFADIQLLSNISKALYHFDDEEVLARRTAMKAEQRFLLEIEKVAKRKKLDNKIIVNTNALNSDLMFEEQSKNRRLSQLLKETQRDAHKLLTAITDYAITTQDSPLLCAIAETQDIKFLANKKIFKNIQQFASQQNLPKLALVLSNSKYFKTPETEAKKSVRELFEAEPKTQVGKLIYNHTPKFVARSCKLFGEDDKNINKSETIVAQEIAINRPLSYESQKFVDKLQNRAEKLRVVPEIIVATEYKSLGTALSPEAQEFLKNQQALEPAQTEPVKTKPTKKHIIIAEEIALTDNEMAPHAEQFVQKIQARTKKIDDEKTK